MLIWFSNFNYIIRYETMSSTNQLEGSFGFTDSTLTDD